LILYLGGMNFLSLICDLLTLKLFHVRVYVIHVRVYVSCVKDISRIMLDPSGSEVIRLKNELV